MMYNMDFLIAGLVFLVLILYHFMSRDRIENMNSREFQIFIVVGILDIVLDIVSSMMIARPQHCYAKLLMVVLTLFYLMQVMVPYALFCYTKSLCPTMMQMGKKMQLFSIPAIVMSVLVIFNIWSRMFFSVTSQGVYVKGPYYIVMYLYALLYALIIMIGSLTHRKRLGKRKMRVIWEFLLIIVTCVAIQAWKNKLLMTGFGIGLGITVMFLTLNNPCEYIDTLTRMFNQQCFVDWVREQMQRKNKFHVLVVDLFQMRKINKLYGAGTGDWMLVEVACELRAIANSPYVFRIGGKRFVVITQTIAEYERVRKVVQKWFQEEVKVGKEKINFPANICGIIDAEKLKDSDELLFYIEYLISLVPETDETILLQGDEKTLQGLRYTKTVEQYLNTAIEEDLFEVYYQPVYSLKRKKYVTLEALSRLRHPSLGPVSPEVFIGAAEKNGRIAELSYLQFRKVCRFLKENQELMEQITNVKFNLSPLELLKPGYSKMLIDVIREFELPFKWFQFEITETVATEYNESLYQAIEDFASCGIGLCLDDFGSGYANLDTVLKLPFSAIKIDKTLLNGIAEEPKSALFYKNIVMVLQSLGYWVIAEGVEYESEKELLHQWGVDMIQGYYFARPMPEEEVLELILNSNY